MKASRLQWTEYGSGRMRCYKALPRVDYTGQSCYDDKGSDGIINGSEGGIIVLMTRWVFFKNDVIAFTDVLCLNDGGVSLSRRMQQV